MKIAVFVLPAYGHIHPVLPLVRELVQRGHALTFYCTEEFRERIERTGARFELLDNPYMQQIHRRNPHLVHLFRTVLEASEELLPELIERVRAERFDAVLSDFMTLWGRVVCSRLGLPKISLYPIFAMNRAVGRLTWAGLLPFLKRPIETIRHLWGMRLSSRRLDRLYGTGAINPETLSIDPDALGYLVFVPRALQPLEQQFDERYHFVGTTLGSSLAEPDFPYERMDASKPLIYISLGTVFNDNIDFFRFCLRSLAGTPYQVALSVGNKINPKDLGNIPDNCIVQPYMPQNSLLRRAALFISHAGMNSASEGIYHQVPMMVLPQQGDQFIVAQRLCELGLAVWGHWNSKRRWLHCIEQVLNDDGIKTKLQAMSQAFKEAGGAKAAADTVEKLLGS